jgi:hypothetical protein
MAAGKIDRTGKTERDPGCKGLGDQGKKSKRAAKIRQCSGLVSIAETYAGI